MGQRCRNPFLNQVGFFREHLNKPKKNPQGWS